LRDLVHVRCEREPAADVQELVDALLGEMPHGPQQEVAVLPDGGPGRRRERHDRLGDLASTG